MPSKIQLIGGAFQDSEGDVLANGYLKFRLSQDASVSGVGNICSGVEITIQLDANGNAVASPAQYVWGNDNLLPINTYYRVKGYTAAGQPAWGPNNQQVEGSGTFDLGTWVPNSVISWQPVITQPLVLKNNGTLNASQTILNLESTDSSIIITDEGGGNINLQSGGATFKTTIGSIASGVAQGSYALNSGANQGMFLQSFNSSALSVMRTASATDPSFVPTQFSTSAQSGGVIDSVLNITLGILTDWFAKVKFVGNTSSRYWVGISDQLSSTANSVFYSQTPAANFVGFRYSVGTDANIVAVCQTDAAHQTVVDTGVAAGSVNKLEFKPSGSSVLFYIDGILVATITTHVPATSVALATIITGDDEGDVIDSNEQLNFYYVYAILSV